MALKVFSGLIQVPRQLCVLGSVVHVEVVGQLVCKNATDHAKRQKLAANVPDDHLDILAGIPITTSEFAVRLEFLKMVDLQAPFLHHRFVNGGKLLQTKESILVVIIAIEGSDEVDPVIAAGVPVIQPKMLVKGMSDTQC